MSLLRHRIIFLLLALLGGTKCQLATEATEANETTTTTEESALGDSLSTAGADKPGRCPSKQMDKSMCTDDVVDQCIGDGDCHGNGKCCSTGCYKVCVRPVSSACELSRENTIRRGRSLGLSETELNLPKCGVDGTFAPIQCHGDRCYCVDSSSGFELPGTRAKSLDAVNCSAPSLCAGYQCRMLCPFDFDLDEEGCPLCQCRDPCRDVACPGGSSCVMEEVPCSQEPCPPLPTCKQPRSLSNICPYGGPLLVDEGAQRPFLCGSAPGKPRCPPLYQCQVNGGHEYGVCCPNVDELTKPGTCPPPEGYISQENTSSSNETSLSTSEDTEEVRCGVACDHDLQCPSVQKCCMSKVCGQHCVRPNNLTACLQERMISELLLLSEKAGKGYVPQCREEDGLYHSRQCAINGLVCWCVDPITGKKFPRTVGPAKEVRCDEGGQDITNSSSGKEDGASLLTSESVVSNLLIEPTQFEAGSGRRRSDSGSTYESSTASLPDKKGSDSEGNLTSALCPYGVDPLAVGGVIAVCTPTTPCPIGYICSPPSDDRNTAVCCPQTIVEYPAVTQCPFMPQGDMSTWCNSDNRCQSDDECPTNSRCCTVAECELQTICTPINAENLTLDSDMVQSPTMCEYLRDLAQLEGVSLALPVPQCQENGAYEPIQCHGGLCWCVDDFGAPIPGTKATSSREPLNCGELLQRSGATCPEVMCRLGCDYGFLRDPETLCPVCECRDPCQEVDCGLVHECQMVDVPCIDGVCPSIPQCAPVEKRLAQQECPGRGGTPYLAATGTDNITLSCSGRQGDCPVGYDCYLNGKEGICCPSQDDDETKPGQCPYLLPSAGGSSCDLECSRDSHCPADHKCCSNGCGTHCLPPIRMTACEHQRAVLEYRAREAGIPSDRVFLPACDPAGGGFEPTQCHPGTLTCWCVDPNSGMEVPGTRVSYPGKPDCQRPVACPAMNCNLACLHGYRLDRGGCPLCGCRDPCEEVQCSSPSEECRIVHVACVGGPCPPLPVCLPKLENPCSTGNPLSINGTMIECGPQGQTCPSSHKCHLSPLGEYALCCPKPRDSCFLPMDSGDCEGSIRRWHFDTSANECRRFRYGGCGGNLNNFESEEECAGACPPLSSCQRLRRKNLAHAHKDNKIMFLPKCDKDSGDWLPAQCLDELGVCWCTEKDGSQVPGTLTRGPPTCHGGSRSGRIMNYEPKTPKKIFPELICEPGQTVHVCDKSICDNKVCLSYPGAVCRVNPCGGCTFEFVKGGNDPSITAQVVDCELGLTECQVALQNVLNSNGFQRPHRIVNDLALTPPEGIPRGIYPVKVGSPLSASYNDVITGGKVSLDRLQRITGKDQETFLESALPVEAFDDARDDGRLFGGVSNDGSWRGEYALPIQSDNHSTKPGTCPALMKDFSLLQCNPTKDCSVDAECPGDSKCCFTGCGTICLEPAESGVLLGMTLEAPQCHSDGSWVREQRSGDLTWCVDSKGRPMHETLTKGHVRCGPNGQILEQMSLGYVCPRGIRPMVCTDECTHAVCTNHPSAVCVADPCNQCRISFYSSIGELVNCEGKCEQPPYQGDCSDSIKRWFFNSSANECQQFKYGGCHGNENNFPSLGECQRECGKKAPTCDQPVEVGRCSDGEARWYYNKDARKCELFLYSGCGGNDNNFPTKEACENTCPDLILCPYWSGASLDPEPCSRSSACRNQTCHGYPDTICKVDPCSCSANFYNLDGERVTCMMPTEEPKTRISFTYEEESSSSGGGNVDSSAFSSGGKRPPVTIFLEGEPSLSRCQLLRQHLLRSNSRRYVAQCDDEGRFIPTQCYSAPFVESFVSEEKVRRRHTPFVESFVPEEKGIVVALAHKDNRAGSLSFQRIELPECWCVDEIGRKTQPTVYFKKGERSCDVVSVESVVVTLGFRRSDRGGLEPLKEGSRQEIKKQVGVLLKHLAAETLENEVKVIALPDLTQVKFTLLGQNKVDVAYQLEDQVRRGGLALRLGDRTIPADLRASWFHHQVSEPSWSAPAHLSALREGKDSPSVLRKPSPREIVKGSLESTYLGASVAISVLAVILICALVVSVVLHRRRLTGQYPKVSRGSLQSLAFSDTSFDSRSFSPRFSPDSTGFRHFSSKGSSFPPVVLPTQGPKNVTTIEEEYKAVAR